MPSKRIIFVYLLCGLALSGCEKEEPGPEHINSPARFTSLAETYHGREEKPIGTIYARMQGVDQDGDSIFFELSENQAFVINNLTGEITNTVVFDVDSIGGTTDFYLHSSVYDSHGEGEQRFFRIRIGDSTADNPAPPIEGPVLFSIQENVHDMVATFENVFEGSWKLQDTTFGVFFLYPGYPGNLNSNTRVSLHATYQDYETLPNAFTGTLVYTYPASGQQSFLYFTLEVTNELDPF